MKNSIIVIVIILSSLNVFAELVDWSSEEGMKKMSTSRHKVDFFKLSNYFESQSNDIYCGPASAVIVLNALRLRKSNVKIAKDFTVLNNTERSFLPKDFDATYEKYTQRSVFNVKKGEAKAKLDVLGRPSKNGKKDFGFQIRQLNQLLMAHGLKTQLRVVSKEKKESEIKRDLIENLKTPGDYVLINYKRQALGQKGGGHFSPLGAYDEKTDSFLIMDVNPNNAPWVWVSTKELISAMRTFDTIENRGYILVSEKGVY